LYQIHAKEFSELSSQWKELAKFLRHVKGVHVAGTYIEFDWGKDGLILSSVFDSFDEWSEEYLHVEKEVIIAVDEAQILRNLKRVKSRTEFRSLLAHCYDNL